MWCYRPSCHISDWEKETAHAQGTAKMKCEMQLQYTTQTELYTRSWRGGIYGVLLIHLDWNSKKNLFH